MRLYNEVPGNVPVDPEPVISKITRQQARSISEWELLPQHKTHFGEDPNQEQCVHWILGTGDYVKEVNRVKGTQVGMIKSVKWSRLKTGETHLERFYKLSSELGDVIRKIPSAQLTRQVQKAQVKHIMCGQVKPSKLLRLVSNAVDAGQDDRPADGRVYNVEWHSKARGDPDMAASIMYGMCKYLDGRERKGRRGRLGRSLGRTRTNDKRVETGRQAGRQAPAGKVTSVSLGTWEKRAVSASRGPTHGISVSSNRQASHGSSGHQAEATKVTVWEV